MGTDCYSFKNYTPKYLREVITSMALKRIAVLDLGTNTFHLLITDVENGLVKKEVLKDYLPVKMGEGGINKKFITTEAFNRGIIAIKAFDQIIKQYNVNQIKAVATSAIRDASNGEDFINRVKSETGIEIEIIDGNREAELIYKGVIAAVTIKDEPVLIMDIGGGSVEFIICNSSQIFWKKSYPIGAARLMETFHHNDPISKSNIQEINDFLDESLKGLVYNFLKFKPNILIGSAGAFETFAELVTLKFNLPKEKLLETEYVFDLNQVNEVLIDLLKSNHSERSNNVAIIPLRVDMIIVATVLTKYIIKTFKITSLKLSNYSLREGVLFDLLK